MFEWMSNRQLVENRVLTLTKNDKTVISKCDMINTFVRMLKFGYNFVRNVFHMYICDFRVTGVTPRPRLLFVCNFDKFKEIICNYTSEKYYIRTEKSRFELFAGYAFSTECSNSSNAMIV